MNDFQVGDRVEWIIAPAYKGTVTRVEGNMLGVMWDGKDGDPPAYATHPSNKHRVIERDPFADKFEVDCD